MKNFLFKTTIGTIASFLSGIMLIAYSKYKYDDYIKIFSEIPIYVYLLILIILVLIYFVNYYKKGKNIVAAGIVQNYDSYEKIDSLDYANLKWNINIPIKSDREKLFDLYSMTSNQINYDEIEIDLPPLCLKCECEIEEKKSLFKYKCICPNCHHSVSNKESIYVLKDKVLKIAKLKLKSNKQ